MGKCSGLRSLRRRRMYRRIVRGVGAVLARITGGIRLGEVDDIASQIRRKGGGGPRYVIELKGIHPGHDDVSRARGRCDTVSPRGCRGGGQTGGGAPLLWGGVGRRVPLAVSRLQNFEVSVIPCRLSVVGGYAPCFYASTAGWTWARGIGVKPNPESEKCSEVHNHEGRTCDG